MLLKVSKHNNKQYLKFSSPRHNSESQGNSVHACENMIYRK